MISERVQKLNTEVEKKGKIITKARKLYLCFVDYQKAFDRVKHDNLLEVMKRAEMPELERRLIINLYWRQSAAVRWDGSIAEMLRLRRE